MKQIIVIGGGAAGMMAAITAAKAGAEVMLLERQPRVGRKLLATGNGRCNITNKYTKSSNYHGNKPNFVNYALEKFCVDDTVDFFSSIGLVVKFEPSGRAYPYTDQAGSVVDVLRFEMERLGIKVKCDCTVRSMTRKKDFVLDTTEGKLTASAVIVAAGGAASAKLGGTSLGYEILGAFGHEKTKLFASLVQLKTDTAIIRALKGIKTDASVKIVSKRGKVIAESVGEVLFTEYGISGPAIFEVSRNAVGCTAVLDLMQEYSLSTLEQMLTQRKNARPNTTLEEYLTGMLNKRIGQCALKYAGLALSRNAGTLNRDEVERVARSIKSFELAVTGNTGLENAQVTAGGILTEDFDPSTMESKLVKGLYAVGEVLDIDGDCGGFNLQWAWSSGHLAGECAAK